jgi:hypothetical protein
LIIVILLSLLYISHTNTQSTTPHIYEVFTGKCFERNPTGTNCSQLWETFSYGAMMDMFTVTTQDFQPFFNVANFSTPVGESLFWSGNMDFANVLSDGGDKFTMLEETSTG